MKIVLDTNLLLVSISRRSETHRIFEALLGGICLEMPTIISLLIAL